MHFTDIGTPGRYGAWGALEHVGQTASAKYDALLSYLNANGGNNNTDRDGDGVPNDQDAFPDDPHEWLDSDQDGIGNNADTDDDNDGMPDVWELQYGLNPLATNDAATDTDGDGLSNLDEYRFGANPSKPDSDTDGMTDKQEVDAGRNPTVNEAVITQIINGLL